MPPKQTTNPITGRLNELGTLLAAGTITAAEHALLRSQALGLPPPTPQAQVVQAVMEDSATRAERETKAMVEGLIGTLQAPLLAGEAWLVFVGESGSGHLRDDVVRICSSSPQRRAFAGLFRSAGRGVTPPCLVGDTPTHTFARHGAREFLRRLALSVCLALMVEAQPHLDKEPTRRLLERVLDQDENVRLANGLLSSVSKMRTAEDTLVKKTSKDQAPTTTATTDPAKNVICNGCKQRGHYERDCPNRTPKDKDARPRDTAPTKEQPALTRRRKGA